MFKYFVCFFHIVIIASFLGCGYKSDPVWPGKVKKENNITKKLDTNDLKIIEINNTMELK